MPIRGDGYSGRPRTRARARTLWVAAGPLSSACVAIVRTGGMPTPARPPPRAAPAGLCALSPSSNTCVLACPGLQKGHLRVELFDIRRPTLISAHESSLSCLALNLDGTRLATASERGTLIRVWDSHTGQALHELRRGAEHAAIQSLAFSMDAAWLAVSSDHGTVHVFSLGTGVGGGAGCALAHASPMRRAVAPRAHA